MKTIYKANSPNYMDDPFKILSKIKQKIKYTDGKTKSFEVNTYYTHFTTGITNLPRDQMWK